MIFKHTTIFDFETTGVKPESDKVIELAAVKIINGEIVDKRSALINPEIPIPEFITYLTGIKDQDVKSKPTFPEVLPIFLDFIGDSILVAHNALFDLNFLNENCQRYDLKWENDFLDTRTICIDRYPYRSHKLEAMCKQLGIKLDGAHRALNDVLATWELLKALHQQKPVDDFKNKLYYFKKYSIPEWKPEHAELIGIGR